VSEIMVKRQSKTDSQMSSPIPGGIQVRALARVGDNDLSRLAWLLELLNRAPEIFAVMAESDRAELEAEVVAFCEPVGTVIGGQASQLTATVAQDLVQAIRGQILGMLEGSTFELEIPVTTVLSFPGSRSRYMGSPEAILRLAVIRLIEAEGQRITVCARPGCGRLFVRRKRALYCRKQCSQLEQFARYIARHAPKTLDCS
jgi:hypothetical protein